MRKLLIYILIILLLLTSVFADVREEVRINMTSYGATNPIGPSTAGGRSSWQSFYYGGETGRLPSTMLFNFTSGQFNNCFGELRQITNPDANPGTQAFTVIANTSIMSNCTAPQTQFNFSVVTGQSLINGYNYSFGVNFTSGGSGSAQVSWTQNPVGNTYSGGREFCYQPTSWFDSCGEGAGLGDNFLRIAVRKRIENVFLLDSMNKMLTSMQL